MSKKLIILLDLPLFVLNYLFLIVSANVLSIDDFGYINTILSVMSIVFVIGSTVQIKTISMNGKVATNYLLSSIVFVVTLSLFIGMVFLKSPLYSVFIILICVQHPMICLIRGLLISQGKKLCYYKSLYAEMLLKFLILVIFSLAFVMNNILMLILFFTVQFLVLMITYFVWKRHSYKITQVKGVSFFKEKSLFANQMLFFTFLNIDILAFEMFAVENSPVITLAVRFAQLPLLLTYTYMQFETNTFKNEESIVKLMKRYLLMVCPLFITFLIGYKVLGEPVVSLFFGEEFAGAVAHIDYYLVKYFVGVLVFILSFYYSLRKLNFYNILFVGFILITTLTIDAGVTFSLSLQSLIITMLVFVFAYIYLFLNKRSY